MIFISEYVRDHRPGPMIASSICIKCGGTFFTSSSNQNIIPGMRINQYERDQYIDRPIQTWGDWLEHITNRCEQCRLKIPPQQCLDDLYDTTVNKKRERIDDAKTELEEDRRKLAPYGPSPLSGRPRIAAVLLGPPASGKGTLGQELSTYCNIPVVMPGGIYRRLKGEDSDMGRQVKKTLSECGYCPDSMTNTVIKEETQKLMDSGARAVIMDGYPRTMDQLNFMCSNFDIAYYVSLDQPYDILLQRAMSRYECPICHSVCSEKVLSLQCACLINPEEHIIRDDDQENMFPIRYETYLKLTQPVVDRLISLPVSDKFRFRNITVPLNKHTTSMLCRELEYELKDLGWV